MCADVSVCSFQHRECVCLALKAEMGSVRIVYIPFQTFQSQMKGEDKSFYFVLFLLQIRIPNARKDEDISGHPFSSHPWDTHMAAAARRLWATCLREVTLLEKRKRKEKGKESLSGCRASNAHIPKTYLLENFLPCDQRSSELSGEHHQCRLHLHLPPLQQEKDTCFSTRRFHSPSSDPAWLFPSTGLTVSTRPSEGGPLYDLMICTRSTHVLEENWGRGRGAVKGALFPAPEEVRRPVGLCDVGCILHVDSWGDRKTLEKKLLWDI